MGHEQELEARWRAFTAEVRAKLGDNFVPLISALKRRDAKTVRLCLRLCQDNSGLAEKIPQNGQVYAPPTGLLGPESHFG